MFKKFVLLVLSITLLSGCLAKEEEKPIIEKVRSLFKSAQVDDMLVVMNHKEKKYLHFIVKNNELGNCLKGNVPIYMNTTSQICVGDLVNIIGTEGTIYIVQKEDVSRALVVMFSIGANFQR